MTAPAIQACEPAGVGSAACVDVDVALGVTVGTEGPVVGVAVEVGRDVDVTISR